MVVHLLITDREKENKSEEKQSNTIKLVTMGIYRTEHPIGVKYIFI